MHDSDVVLRRAHVAGILERDPGMPRLENHREHLLPEVEGFDLVAVDLPLFGELLVAHIKLLELPAIGLMEVGHLVRPEESPGPARLHPFHEQVRNPVRRIHVMGTTPVVTRVLPQLEEFEDVVVPALQIGAAGPPTFAPLINSYKLIIMKL